MSGFDNEQFKEDYINKMTEKLVVLRTMLHMSQAELAQILGIGRQTLVAIETRKRPMTWNMFLSLMFVFSQRKETMELLVVFGIYDEKLKTIYVDGDMGRYEACQ